ncbi:MAG: hypothetical protein M0Z29_09005 [Actinomycetota bacterium]|nr:hypothetical protein [Actinomycetota bacterium]
MPVLNADEFLTRFRGIRGEYLTTVRPLLQRMRASLVVEPTAGETQAKVDLEAHVRVYVVDSFLAALNWRMDVSAADGSLNLMPEMALRSLEKGTTRFLDYLGIERKTGAPLMVVETKRPSSALPMLRESSDMYARVNHSAIVSQGLNGTGLAYEWNKWLDTLRDYVRSVQVQAGRTPARAVITNGDWFILFLDPADSFLEAGARDPAKILVIEGSGGWDPNALQAAPSEMERRYTEVFEHLEYQRVLGKAPTLSPGTVAFNIQSQNVRRVMHGLKLRYEKLRNVHTPSPHISLAPVLFLQSQFGTWLTVDASNAQFELPHEEKLLAQHLADVEAASKALLAQMNRALGTSIAPTELTSHYADAASFETLSAVRETSDDEYVVVTGDETHYLRAKPTVSKCSFHDAAASFKRGVGMAPAIMARSLQPRAFFISGENHHCAHQEVWAAKASPITAANEAGCGSRSGKQGQAFCEIWRVDQYLCCRACVFESVCTKAAVFHLPCHPQGGATRTVSGG